MSGASGFVGSHLSESFAKKGWQVIALGRKDFALSNNDLAAKMIGGDVIVNLAGAPVIGRWTADYKKIMYDSRINITKKLVQACSLMKNKPALFISTSAIGFYADEGVHTETNFQKSDGFLGHLAQDWEREALKAEELGIRTIIFRFAVVLGKNGGALQKMLLPFKLGLGGKIGDGKQPFSWIHIKDLIRAYLHIIDSPSLSGTYNLSAPHPTTNKKLTKAMGKALCRPTFFSIPRFVLRLQFGEGAQTITGGQKVLPQRLLEGGFKFEFEDIEKAVKDCVD